MVFLCCYNIIHVHVPIPQPQQVKGSKLSSSLEVVAISEVQVIMRHLQRAVVLASRGRHWTLLQNTARALWNTIHTLIQVSSPRERYVYRLLEECVIYYMEPEFFTRKIFLPFLSPALIFLILQIFLSCINDCMD